MRENNNVGLRDPELEKEDHEFFKKLVPLTQSDTQEEDATISNMVDDTENSSFSTETRKGEGIWGATVKFIQEELDYAERFTLQELCMHLGIFDAETKKTVSKAVYHLIRKGDVTKGGKLGTWRKADASLVAIPLLEDDDEECFSEFKIPLLQDYIKVDRGNVLLFAGYTSTGKTCLGINFVRLNQYLFEGVDYFSNQHGQVKKRLVAFKNYNGLTKKDWKFNLYERTENFDAVIKPENLTVIDFLSATDGDYSKMGALISAIHNKVENQDGVAIVFIQKPPHRNSGYGSHQTHSFANFSAILDNASEDNGRQKTIKIIKSKLTPQHEGKIMKYHIEKEGTDIISLSPLEYASSFEAIGG